MFGARLSIESDNHGLIIQRRRIHILSAPKEHCWDSRRVVRVVWARTGTRVQVSMFANLL